MYIKLKTLREECGGCPTSYSGETTDGHRFEAYLRHGHMYVSLDDVTLFDAYPDDLDGVCSFSDFKIYARINGFLINDSDAEESSYIEDMNDLVERLHTDRKWIKMLKTIELKTLKETFFQGEKYRVYPNVAETLIEYEYAVETTK